MPVIPWPMTSCVSDVKKPPENMAMEISGTILSLLSHCPVVTGRVGAV